jgi:hypothetical protein
MFHPVIAFVFFIFAIAASAQSLYVPPPPPCSYSDFCSRAPSLYSMSVTVSPSSVSPPQTNLQLCALHLQTQFAAHNYSLVDGCSFVASYFPPELSVPLSYLKITFRTDFLWLNLSSLDVPSLEIVAYRPILKQLFPWTPVGYFFFSSLSFLLVSTGHMPLNYVFYGMLTTLAACSFAVSSFYVACFYLLLFTSSTLMRVTAPPSDTVDSYSFLLQLMYGVFTVFSLLILLLPHTNLPPTASFLPLLLLIPVGASLFSYGSILSKTVAYNFPFFSLTVGVYVVTALALFADSGPILYDGSPLSAIIIPSFLRLPAYLASSLTFPGYFIQPLLAAYASVSPLLDMETREITDVVFRPFTLQVLAILLHFLPSYQVFYVQLQHLLGRVRLTREDKLPPFRVALYLAYVGPVKKVLPTPLPLISRFWSATTDITVLRLVDLIDLCYVVTFLRYPWYFASYCLVTLLLFTSNASPGELPAPVPQASVAAKLAKLREMFPKALTVHKYMDKAPDSVIHSLYATHVTGSTLLPPQPVRQYYELLESLLIESVQLPDEAPLPMPPLSMAPYNPPPPHYSAPQPPTISPARIASGIRTRYAALTKLRVEAAPNTEAPSPALLDRLRACTTTLYSGVRTFTGFFVRNNVIATVAHGKDGSHPITHPQLTVTREGVYPDDDLLFLEVEGKHPSLLASPKAVSPQTPVVLLTLYPNEIIVHGVVLASHADAVFSTLPTKPGSSGSAVVTTNGHLVSMHQGRTSTTAVSLPSSTIAARLAHFLSQGPTLPSQTPPLQEPAQ